MYIWNIVNVNYLIFILKIYNIYIIFNYIYRQLYKKKYAKKYTSADSKMPMFVHSCFKIISDLYFDSLTKWQVYALSIFWHQIS